MDRITLDASPRTVVGKKVRFMRRNGIIPANVFGHNVASQSVEVQELALERALARAGTNTLVNLNVAGAAEAYPVLIRSYQRKATSGKLLHVDLYQVSMTEKLTTDVPLVLIGTAPGVALGGVLLQNVDSVEIECLPGDLVSSIQVDFSGLAEMNQALLVSDLKVSDAITVLTHRDTLIVKVAPPEEEEVEEAAVTEAGLTAEAAEPAEGAAEKAAE